MVATFCQTILRESLPVFHPAWLGLQLSRWTCSKAEGSAHIWQIFRLMVHR